MLSELTPTGADSIGPKQKAVKMKSLLARALALAFLFTFEAQTHAVLIYEVSAPVGGQGQLGITDFGGDQLGRVGDAARVTYGTMQSTVYFDPETGTLRQVGYVPLIIDDQIVLNRPRQINGETVEGVLTINQTFSRDRYHFDTGTLPLIFDSETSAHLGNPLGAPSNFGFLIPCLG